MAQSGPEGRSVLLNSIPVAQKVYSITGNFQNDKGSHMKMYRSEEHLCDSRAHSLHT